MASLLGAPSQVDRDVYICHMTNLHRHLLPGKSPGVYMTLVDRGFSLLYEQPQVCHIVHAVKATCFQGMYLTTQGMAP